MSLRINESEVFLEPLFRCRNSDLVDRDRITVNFVCGANSEDHEHRTLDFAASEISPDCSRCEECAVDVVMPEYAESSDVFSRQGNGRFVHGGVRAGCRLCDRGALAQRGC